MPSCDIRCEHCHEWFRSSIQFGNKEAFFTSTLVGNITRCEHCGQATSCNHENMRFRVEDEGFVGNKA